MEMKKCKECGKLFVPKSLRQQYCDGPHFRPCPVCGTLVEAKYLSDPARCCSAECKKKLADKRRQSVSADLKTAVTAPTRKQVSAEDDSTLRTMKFRRDSVCGFIKGHTYLVDVQRDQTYQIRGVMDLTTQDDQCQADIRLSSKISIERYVEEVR